MKANLRSSNCVLFSIILPTYKVFFLQECIDSILAQTYKNFELIIVNDGSPHDIDAVINLYSDSRIFYYKRENGLGAKHLVDNWNDCLQYVTGDYIINMGDDDCLLPNCLQGYIDLLEKYPNLDIYHTRTQIIDETGSVIGLQPEAPIYESVYSFMWSVWFGGRLTFIGDFLFKADSLKKNGGFYNIPYAWHSDRISAYIMAKKKGIANTNVCGFQFRKSTHEISSNTTITNEKILLWPIIREWYIDFFSYVPQKAEDKKKHILLKRKLDIFIENSILVDIDSDLYSNKWHILKWIINKRKFQLSMRVIAISFYNFLIKLFRYG